MSIMMKRWMNACIVGTGVGPKLKTVYSTVQFGPETSTTTATPATTTTPAPTSPFISADISRENTVPTDNDINPWFILLVLFLGIIVIVVCIIFIKRKLKPRRRRPPSQRADEHPGRESIQMETITGPPESNSLEGDVESAVGDSGMTTARHSGVSEEESGTQEPLMGSRDSGIQHDSLHNPDVCAEPATCSVADDRVTCKYNQQNSSPRKELDHNKCPPTQMSVSGQSPSNILPNNDVPDQTHTSAYGEASNTVASRQSEDNFSHVACKTDSFNRIPERTCGHQKCQPQVDTEKRPVQETGIHNSNNDLHLEENANRQSCGCQTDDPCIGPVTSDTGRVLRHCDITNENVSHDLVPSGDKPPAGQPVRTRVRTHSSDCETDLLKLRSPNKH